MELHAPEYGFRGAPVVTDPSTIDADVAIRGIGPRLVGAVFTEYVPALDRDGLSAPVVARLMIMLLSGLPAARRRAGPAT